MRRDTWGVKHRSRWLGHNATARKTGDVKSAGLDVTGDTLQLYKGVVVEGTDRYPIDQVKFPHQIGDELFETGVGDGAAFQLDIDETPPLG